MILALLVNLMKWVQLAILLHDYSPPKIIRQYLALFSGIGIGILTLVALYKCINTCPNVLVVTGITQDDPSFVVLYVLYILVATSLVVGYVLNLMSLTKYYKKKIELEE